MGADSVSWEEQWQMNDSEVELDGFFYNGKVDRWSMVQISSELRQMMDGWIL